MSLRSLGTVGPRDVHVAVLAASRHAYAPRVAADLAVLHEAALHVGFDVDFDRLATVRTGHQVLIVHTYNIAPGG